MFGSAAPGKSRHRQIRGTPEEVYGAALPDEASSKCLEDPVRLHENPPESVGILPIVRAVGLVLIESDRIGHLVRPLMDVHP